MIPKACFPFVIYNIRRMKIRLVADEQVAIGGAKGRAVGREDVARDFAEVEIGGEKITPPFVAPAVETRHFQTAGGAGAEVRHHGHERAGARVAFERAVLFAPHAAVNGVEDAVAFSVGGPLQEGAGEQALAAGREDDIHGVVHARSDDSLEARAVGPHAVKVRSAADKIPSITELEALLGEPAFAPIDETIRPGVGAVEIVGAAGERLTVEPHLALVGHAVLVGVGELPDLRRGGDVERAVEPHCAFGKHHLVGKDGALVELAIAVRVHEAHDAMRLFRELLFHGIIRARTVGYVEFTRVPKRHRDGPVHERWPGCEFHRQSFGQRESVDTDFEFSRMNSRGKNEGE